MLKVRIKLPKYLQKHLYKRISIQPPIQGGLLVCEWTVASILLETDKIVWGDNGSLAYFRQQIFFKYTQKRNIKDDFQRERPVYYSIFRLVTLILISHQSALDVSPYLPKGNRFRNVLK